RRVDDEHEVRLPGLCAADRPASRHQAKGDHDTDDGALHDVLRMPDLKVRLRARRNQRPPYSVCSVYSVALYYVALYSVYSVYSVAVAVAVSVYSVAVAISRRPCSDGCSWRRASRGARSWRGTARCAERGCWPCRRSSRRRG